MKRTHSNLLALICSLGLYANCAITVDSEEGIEASDYNMVNPILHHITPSLSLGERLEVTGAGFVPADVGNFYLKFVGNFNGVLHGEESVNKEVPLLVESESRAAIILEQVFFDSEENDIGTFSGTVTLINKRSTGGSEVKSLSSEAQSINITVNPSIAMTRLRAIDANIACNLVTSGSNGKQDLEVGFKALGLGTPTAENPWTVTVSYTAPQMDIYYINEDTYEPTTGAWPLGWIPLDNNPDTVRKFEADGREPKRASFSFVADGSKLAQDGSIIIEPKSIPQLVKINPTIDIGRETISEGYLMRFQTGEIENGTGDTMSGGFNISIDTRNGDNLTRPVNFQINDTFSVGSNQKQYLRKIGEIEPVSGCQPCSIDGPQCELNYTDSESFSLQRTLAVNVDQSATGDITNTAGPWYIWQIASTRSWTDSFGENYSEAITEESTKSISFSVPVIPGYQAQSYRQAVTIEKHREIIMNNACGFSQPVGFAVHTDYLVGVQVATGQGCPVQSDYQTPQTFNPPVPYENPHSGITSNRPANTPVE